MEALAYGHGRAFVEGAKGDLRFADLDRGGVEHLMMSRHVCKGLELTYLTELIRSTCVSVAPYRLRNIEK